MTIYVILVGSVYRHHGNSNQMLIHLVLVGYAHFNLTVHLNRVVVHLVLVGYGIQYAPWPLNLVNMPVVYIYTIFPYNTIIGVFSIFYMFKYDYDCHTSVKSNYAFSIKFE